MSNDASRFSLSRRTFLGNVGGATLVAGVVGMSSLLETQGTKAGEIQQRTCELGPTAGVERADKAFQIRRQAAEYEKNLPLPKHPCAGDEAFYLNKIANYSKALPHNDLGEVDLNAYQALILALTTGQPADFEKIPMAGPVKLVNPQAADLRT